MLWAFVLLLTTSCATPEPPPPSLTTRTAGDWRVAKIMETASEFQIVELSKISARNCAGPNPIRIRESLSKASTQEITLGGGVSAGIAFIIVASLEAKYEVTNGEQIEKTVEFEVEAKPGTYFEYPVAWKAVWAEGHVVVERSDGTQKQVPFSVKHSLRGELMDPVDVGCD